MPLMNKTLLLIALLTYGFVNAQIENNMTAHFPFDGNYTDISTSGIVANNVGTTFGIDRNSAANQALELGTNKYVSFNDSAVKTSLPLTISTWVKFNSFSEKNMIFTSDNVYDNYHGYWLNTEPITGQVTFSYAAGLGGSIATNRRTVITDSQLSVGVWYHIVVIVRGHKNMEVYFDCEKQPSSYTGNGSTGIIYSSTESRIGSSIGSITQQDGLFCDGSIDQLAIWNRAITSDQLTFLCEKTNTLSAVENSMEKTPKVLVKIINMLGQEVEKTKMTPLIYRYSDGSSERIIITE